MGWFASVFIAMCLAATTGLRAFLPLFLLAVMSNQSLIGDWRVPEQFAWAQSNAFIAVLGVLALLEIVADKASGVAKFIDPLVLFVRPVASVFTCMMVLKMPTVGANFLVGMAIGLLFGLPVLRLKGGYRMMKGAQASNYFDVGLSLAEDILTTAAVYLSFLSPVVVFVVILVVAFWLETRVRLQAVRAGERGGAVAGAGALRSGAQGRVGYGVPPAGAKPTKK